MIDDILRSSEFSPMDRALCETLGRITGEKDDNVLLALALVSWSISQGHLCLNLKNQAGSRLSEILTDSSLSRDIKLPSLENWLSALNSSPLVGNPGDYKPLILDQGDRLYLYRYWHYEQLIANRITGWTEIADDKINPEILRNGLERYFPPGSEKPDWQRIAAIAAMYRPFTVISGGPGTGKTTTVLKIILLYVEQALELNQKPSIALAAPTGKAASRLIDAVNSEVEKINVSDILRSQIPREAHTLHRLLKIFPGSVSPYNAENPLPQDLVIVDESSMVNVSLMAALIQATGADSRLILLGDRDQLASVEAGSVFGDICDRGCLHGYSDTFISHTGADIPAMETSHRMADSLVILRKVYRYTAESGIGLLSAAVRDGDADGAVRILESGNYPDILYRVISSKKNLDEIICEAAAEIQRGYSGHSTPTQALEHLYDCMVLSPVRSGLSGVDSLNMNIERNLEVNGLIRADRRFYHGRPVMVKGNDYTQRLFNGDMGLVWRDENGYRVYFNGPDNILKDIIPVKLPDHDTVYAMTVHKSQGSEFRDIVLILPQVESPVMTRELLYTAISRARRHIVIAGTPDIIRSMIQRPAGRTSGLRDRLWK